MRTTRKWLIRSLVAVAAAAGLALTPMLVPAAGAAEAAGATLNGKGATTAANAVAQQVPVYLCNLRLDYPHPSSHVPGTINVEAQTTCNLPIPGISMEIALYQDGVLVGYNTASNTGGPSNNLYINTQSICTSGGYEAYAYTSVVFPFGTTPPSLSDVQSTSPQSIQC